MHWKLKSAIQNAVSLLPSSISYAGYYWLQRRFGGLRRLDPWARIAAGVKTWKLIEAQGCNPRGKVFLEVGTGRTAIVPMCYWLMGAGKTITVDLNPYLREELVRASARCLAESRTRAETLFGPLLDAGRLESLLALAARPDASLKDFLDLCQIQYLAPADATATGLPVETIDFHTSYTVFEHIPRDVLLAILREGARILRKDGFFIHGIDYSDHFSHSDRSISAINFLQYADARWDRYAGNRYMYMNRLRHDDFMSLYAEAAHELLHVEEESDARAHALLQSGDFLLDTRFRDKSTDVLAITSSWVVSKVRGGGPAR